MANSFYEPVQFQDIAEQNCDGLILMSMVTKILHGVVANIFYRFE